MQQPHHYARNNSSHRGVAGSVAAGANTRPTNEHLAINEDVEAVERGDLLAKNFDQGFSYETTFENTAPWAFPEPSKSLSYRQNASASTLSQPCGNEADSNATRGLHGERLAPMPSEGHFTMQGTWSDGIRSAKMPSTGASGHLLLPAPDICISAASPVPSDTSPTMNEGLHEPWTGVRNDDDPLAAAHRAHLFVQKTRIAAADCEKDVDATFYALVWLVRLRLLGVERPDILQDERFLKTVERVGAALHHVADAHMERRQEIITGMARVLQLPYVPLAARSILRREPDVPSSEHNSMAEPGTCLLRVVEVLVDHIRDKRQAFLTSEIDCPRTRSSEADTHVRLPCIRKGCGAIMKSKPAWEKHEAILDPEKLWMCMQHSPPDRCFIFHRKERLKAHCKESHRMSSDHAELYAQQCKVYNGKAHRRCGFCGRGFESWSEFYKKHVPGHLIGPEAQSTDKSTWMRYPLFDSVHLTPEYIASNLCVSHVQGRDDSHIGLIPSGDC